MKFDWRQVSRTAAAVLEGLVPGAVAVEQGVEGAISAKTGPEKAEQVIEAAIGALQAEGKIVGKQYATARVKRAIRDLNDDGVELLNALAEAHAQEEADVEETDEAAKAEDPE